MLRIGLTGGIGSGKSSVAAEFKRMGISVFDLDQIAREIVEPNTIALDKIVEHFGDELIQANGKLNREGLRQIIFEDSAQRQWLENLLHPLIRERQLELESTSNSPYVVVEIPLLVENLESQQVDRILVVELSEESQVKRTMERSSIPEAEVFKIISNQATPSERRKVAHDLINNNGSMRELVDQVERLHRKYLEIAGATQGKGEN